MGLNDIKKFILTFFTQAKSSFKKYLFHRIFEIENFFLEEIFICLNLNFEEIEKFVQGLLPLFYNSILLKRKTLHFQNKKEEENKLLN